MKWHDGKPFTAADVAFSISEVWSKLHPRSGVTWSNLSGVETPDDMTVVVRLSKPVPSCFRCSAIGTRRSYPSTSTRTPTSAPTRPTTRLSAPGPSSSKNGSAASISGWSATRPTGKKASPISTRS